MAIISIRIRDYGEAAFKVLNKTLTFNTSNICQPLISWLTLMAPASSVARSTIDSLVGLSQPLIATSQETLSAAITGVINCAKLTS